MSLRTLADAVAAFVRAVARGATGPSRAEVPVPVRVERRPPPPRL